MECTRLGGTGPTVSRIRLGMMSHGSRRWRDRIASITPIAGHE